MDEVQNKNKNKNKDELNDLKYNSWVDEAQNMNKRMEQSSEWFKDQPLYGNGMLAAETVKVQFCDF